jgi:hypothetical protein
MAATVCVTLHLAVIICTKLPVNVISGIGRKVDGDRSETLVLAVNLLQYDRLLGPGIMDPTS